MKLTTLTPGALRPLYCMLWILCDLRRKVVLTPAYTKGELKQGVPLLLQKHRSLACLVVTLFTQFSQTVLPVVSWMRQSPLPCGSTILSVDLCLSPGLHADLSLWTLCYGLPILLPHPASMTGYFPFCFFLGNLVLLWPNPSNNGFLSIFSTASE